MKAEDWRELTGKILHVRVVNVIPQSKISHSLELEVLELNRYATLEIFEYDEEGQRDAL